MYQPKKENKNTKEEIEDRDRERERIIIQLPRLKWCRRWITIPLSAIEIFELEKYFNVEPRNYMDLSHKMKQYILDNVRKELYESGNE